MDAVYLAERADGKFEQKVALKLLKREMNTSALRRRFQQEREIIASLEHPKAVAADLKPIYTVVTEDEALYSLELFAEQWDARYPIIAKSWKANWSKISPMFRFP